MNSTSLCLTPRRILQLRADELPPEELAQIEEHLGECPTCQRLLDDSAANPLEWRDLRESLVNEESYEDGGLPAGEPDAEPYESPAHERLLELLGPTDDPRMLGRIGPYEIVGILGRGGMGVVFKGFDAALNRYVAIKMLLPHLATTGAARKRFAREAQAAAAVIDEHVMAIHGVAEWQGVPYLVMPYTRGVSLQKRLTDRGPLELREALRIGAQVAKALAAAHAQGLVHRDVKPANILLADGVERVSLMDFGLARAIDDASLTRTGVLAGTPQYMSPEQARGNAVDARSDLFSLGSVLYAICTGRAPFRAESCYGVLRLITDEAPRPIRELNPDMPQWLGAIIGRLMAKQPADRFASAAEVAQLLEGCLAHVQQPANVSLPTLASMSAPFRLRSLFSKGVLAMCTLMAAGLLGMVLWQASEPPDISGAWTGAEWGVVDLAQTAPGEYQGAYSQTHNDKPGTIRITWSRVERRFNGAWSEGADCHGEVSLRLTGGEIRGSFTTDASSKIEPGLKPKLGDIRLVRSAGAELIPEAAITAIVRQLEGDWEIVPGQEPIGPPLPDQGVLSFRGGIITHRTAGTTDLRGILEIDRQTANTRFAMQGIAGGELRGVFEFPKDGSLVLKTPDTKVRPKPEGKQPDRVLKLRRIGEDAIGKEDLHKLGLAFLARYPKLSGLTIGMSEADCQALIAKQKLPLTATVRNHHEITYYIRPGDSHTVLVKFREGKCKRIQRVAGETDEDRPESDEEAEYKRFEGTWRIITQTIDRAVEIGGFGKDGIPVVKDRQLGDAAIILDPSQSPREIDLTFSMGPHKGKMLRGIYEWIDDAKVDRPGVRLRICLSTRLSEAGDKVDNRPRDFKMRGEIDLSVWERVVVGHPRGVSKEPVRPNDTIGIPMPAEPDPAAAWQLFRGDSQASGVARGPIPDKPELLWKFVVEKGAFAGSAAIDRGRVFIGDQDGTLHCLDLKTGKKLWELKTDAGFNATPAVRNSLVYIGDMEGKFHCLDAKNGETKWRFKTGAQIDSSANFYKQCVLVGSQDAALYCLDCQSGELTWKFTTTDQIRGSPTVVGNRAFVAGCDSKLHIVDLNIGAEEASVPIEAPSGATPAVLGDQVFLGTEAGAFFAVDWKQAKVAWTFDPIENTPPIRSSPAVTEGRVIFGGRNKRVTALSPKTGERMWIFAAKDRLDSSPVVVGERVFIGSADGRLYSLNIATGELVWIYEAGGGFSGSPAVAEGRLIVASDNGVVYCFGAPKYVEDGRPR